MPLDRFYVLKDIAHPVGGQDGYFYFRLFLLSRKAMNAMINPAKAMSKLNIPMITIMVSYAILFTIDFFVF